MPGDARDAAAGPHARRVPADVWGGHRLRARRHGRVDQDDDGIAILLDEQPAAEHLDGVREAVAICPAAAIPLVEQ